MARLPSPVAVAAAPPASAWLHAVGIVAAGLFAWWGCWHGQYLFDDHPAIVGNEALQAGGAWAAAFGPQHQPLANRPLACLSLVLDFAVFGPGPFGPHLANVLLHLGNALLLWLVLRAALAASNLRERVAGRGRGLASAIALLWVCHPLATDAVAYATQRSTLLFSGFLLMSLWATLRAAASPSPFRWWCFAVLAMAAGMASKEDCVVGPLLVLLAERAFVLPDWRSLRVRVPFLLAMAGTWSVLLLCVALGPHNPTVGFAAQPNVTALQWLQTQAFVLWHYLRLTLVPWPLRGAYADDYVRDLLPALLPGLAVLALLVGVVRAWRNSACLWLAWCGALFFLLLAPTSSVLPIVTEVLAERRMYLPMLAVLVPVAVLASRWLRGAAAGAATVVVALGLACLAREHAAHYRDEPTFWADAFGKREVASRSFLAAQILSNHGLMLMRAGQVAAAGEALDVAMQCESPTAIERVHHAVSLQLRGRADEAVAKLRELVALRPEHADALGALGTTLAALHDQAGANARSDDPRLREAELVLQRAVTVAPRRAAFWNTLGYVCKAMAHWADAEIAFRRACELSTEHLEPFLSRAEVLGRLGRGAEVQTMFQQLFLARPRDVALRLQFARNALAKGDARSALQLVQQALAIEPQHAEANALRVQLETGGR